MSAKEKYVEEQLQCNRRERKSMSRVPRRAKELQQVDGKQFGDQTLDQMKLLFSENNQRYILKQCTVILICSNIGSKEDSDRKWCDVFFLDKTWRAVNFQNTSIHELDAPNFCGSWKFRINARSRWQNTNARTSPANCVECFMERKIGIYFTLFSIPPTNNQFCPTLLVPNTNTNTMCLKDNDGLVLLGTGVDLSSFTISGSGNGWGRL